MISTENWWKYILGAGIPLLWVLWLFSYATQLGPSPFEGDIKVIIPKDSGFSEIQRILAENGIIQDDVRFRLLARMRGVGRQIRAGEYKFSTSESPWGILADLKQGRKMVWQPVTFPEGLTMNQLADILAQKGLTPQRENFLNLARDPAYINSLGLTTTSLEGYLFPDTYNLSAGMDEAAIIGKMVKQTLAVFDELAARKNNTQNLSRHEILILASIVEKEVADTKERPLVAAVFMNRLRQGMPLQADPTVIYGLSSFNGDLTREDLKKPSPYNTYLNRGLPPGPIANPGRASIAAALAPASEPYLYFVSKNDGTHYFSTTLAQHNEAVDKFQRSQKF